MMNALRHMTHLLATGVLTAITVGLASTAHAFSIAQSPLFLSTAVPPNIMFILDDSGSMQTEVMPDSLWSNSNGNSGWMMFPRANRIYCPTCGSERENYVVSFEDGDDYSETRRSSHRNAVFYNPATTYRTWLNADGTPFPNADPTRAYHNPYAPGRGFRDLTNDNTQSAQWVTTNGRTGNESRTFYPAIYYVYDGVGDEDSADSYTRVEIRPANAPFTGSAARTDCAAAPSCTYAEEMQNFANWYSYYRSRVLSARAGIGRAFAQQSRNLRVGFGAINETGNSVDGDTTDTIISGVRPFDGADRANWFDNLYGHDIPYSATPLRRALDDAGQYFSRQDNRGPWGATPGTDDPSPQLECRQNYTILMTDGYWCGAAASTSEARGQVDRDDGPVISSPDGATYQYQGGPPYEDAYSNTLADVAMYYWYRDLRTDLPNAVPTNAQDEAFWQHMVTFGVSLGVTGTLEETDWDDLVSGDQSWPDPDTSSGSCSVETRLDDLWHAGVNGRGGFFSAAEPDAFAEGLSDSLSNIADRIGSAASVASNSTRLEADSLIYQARFNSTDWSGDLLSFTVNPATGAVVSQDWSAADKLDASVATRNILTYDGGSGGSAGATFVWSNLTDAQKTALGGSVRGQAVVDFLRGDRSCEREQVVGSCGYDLDGDGTTGDSGDQAFRARGSRLGDIVSSDPAYSGDEDFGFSVFDSSYTSYVASKASRTPAVFVGANDGMLHAFDARASASNGGEELFAYVPSSLIPDLADLADPAYTHRYYVDGSPVVIDAKIGTGSNAWRTVVVGSTGAGGRTVFALDIT
ncbi:MAG: PilC/PilY family type IV pilus protein, partial [Chromatiales bacterium]